MNWGKGLIIGMVCFIGFIMTMVIIMMNQKVDLVTDNYYLKELEYDKTYDAESTYASAREAIVVHIDNGYLVLEIPKAFQEDTISGYLFRPNNSANDLHWAIKPNDRIQLPMKQLPKGRYELTLTGKYQDQPFESHYQLTW